MVNSYQWRSMTPMIGVCQVAPLQSISILVWRAIQPSGMQEAESYGVCLWLMQTNECVT